MTDNGQQQQKARLTSMLGQNKQYGRFAPAFRFGFRLPSHSHTGFTQILPFRRHWPAILVMLVLAGGMSIPLFKLSADFRQMDDMFDLTSNLFSLFWGLGWSAGVLLLVGVALTMLLARERVIVEPDSVTIRIEALGFAAQATYQRKFISHLRYITDRTIAGADWRKRHLTFDYLGNPVSLGFDLEQPAAAALCHSINTTLRSPIPIRPSYDLDTLAREIADTQNTAANVEDMTVQPAQTPTVITDSESGKFSLRLLVLSNLVPLLGALLFGWQISDLMLLFWLESAIIGFFNILKMFRIAGIPALFYSLFFVGHFGAFMAVHLMFVFALFFEDGDTGKVMTLTEAASIFRQLWPAILALVISHGFSFTENFLGRKEYLTTSIKEQMHKPYSRIVLMHLTLIIGGFLILLLDSPILPLALLVGLKIIVDLKAHKREHGRSGVGKT